MILEAACHSFQRRNHGAGLINLVISLVIVFLLIMGYIRTFSGAISRRTFDLLETRLQDDLATLALQKEQFPTDHLIQASATVLLLWLDTNQDQSLDNDEFVEYRVDGVVPNRTLSRIDRSGTQALLKNIVKIHINYYDQSGDPIFTPITAQKAKAIDHVSMEVSMHLKENVSSVIDDGIQAIDLDGKPSNGTAPIVHSTIVASTRTSRIQSLKKALQRLIGSD